MHNNDKAPSEPRRKIFAVAGLQYLRCHGPAAHHRNCDLLVLLQHRVRRSRECKYCHPKPRNTESRSLRHARCRGLFLGSHACVDLPEPSPCLTTCNRHSKARVTESQTPQKANRSGTRAEAAGRCTPGTEEEASRFWSVCLVVRVAWLGAAGSGWGCKHQNCKPVRRGIRVRLESPPHRPQRVHKPRGRKLSTRKNHKLCSQIHLDVFSTRWKEPCLFGQTPSK